MIGKQAKALFWILMVGMFAQIGSAMAGDAQACAELLRRESQI